MELLINLTKIRNDNLIKIINEKTKNLQINLKFPARSTYSIHKKAHLKEYISKYKNHQGRFNNLAINEKGEIIFDIELGNRVNYESVNINYNIDKTNETPNTHSQNIALIDTLARIAICKKRIPHRKSTRDKIAQPNRNRKIYNEHLKKTLLDVFNATKTLHNIPDSTIDNIKKIYKKHFSLQMKKHITKDNLYYCIIYFTYNEELNSKNKNGCSLIVINPTMLDGLLFLRKDGILDANNYNKNENTLTLKTSESGTLTVKYKKESINKKVSISTLNKLELDKNETIVPPFVNDQSTSTPYKSLIIDGITATKQQIINFINNLERELSIDNVGPRRLFSDDR
ncbi:hypothetical protein ACPV5Y_13635 [Vibrio alfacsensis]|uniref:hypothetical protein n=1 Tax=Vibrio alfacsensis TaxID=1074311 RepID=UPI0040688BD1